jgi:hypothetical protein
MLIKAYTYKNLFIIFIPNPALNPDPILGEFDMSGLFKLSSRADDEDVYLEKLQTRGVKISILYM